MDVKFVGCTTGVVTQEESHTGFLIHLPSAVHAFIFLARRIQPFLSLVDREVEFCVVVVVVYLTLTDPLRIQPWSQDRRNQTKSNRESEISRESREKRTDKKVASKRHRRDKIENTDKNTQTVETNQRQQHKNAGKVAL